MRQGEIKFIATNTANKVTKVITDLIWKTETLAALIIQNEGDIDDFDKVAAILVNDASIRNVSIAPGGIVTKIFPLKGNETVRGLDLLGSGGSAETRTAKETGKLTLAGPFKLVQGGEALTGRLPVHIPDGHGGKKFWGFVAIALNYPQVLNAAYLDELYQHGYAGEIWRISPETGRKQVIWQSKDAVLETPETQNISLFNVTWHISVARMPSIFSRFENWTYLALGLLISVLIASVSYHYVELKNLKSAMENMAMTDTLTGLPNRRHFINELETAVNKAAANGGFLSLAYLDLNNFKMVNDTMGHESGDNVLAMSAEKLISCIRPEDFAARLGGDEFIVMLDGIGEGEKLNETLKAIDNALQLPVIGKDGNIINVSASIGVAIYPRDGRSVHELLHRADLKMYAMKKKLKAVVKDENFINHFR